VPDVKMFYDERLNYDQNFPKFVRQLVARQMSCWVDGEQYDMRQNEIDLFLLPCMVSSLPVRAPGRTMISKSNVIIEICAYAYPNRMEGIENKLKRIAEGIKKELGENARISITFFAVQAGCWTSA
jgi:hypothetical protein